MPPLSQTLLRLPAVLGLIGACVIGTATVRAQAAKPLVLMTETNSTRAIAFDSVSFKKEPFAVSTPFSADGRMRIMVFALNLTFAANEDVSAITADAESGDHVHHSLRVEYAAPLSSLPWLSAVNLRLSDDIVADGDVLVSLTFHGVRSNRVRVGIGTVGGGPVDDNGALPTPAPPYVISGRVTSPTGEGFGGVNLVLKGDQVQAITTGESGEYSFLINTFGSYTLNAGKTFFNFTPAVRTFDNLSSNQSNTNFAATRQMHIVSGKIVGDHEQPLAGISITLSDGDNVPIKTVITTTDGVYVFSDLPAGFDYQLTPLTNPFFTFSQQAVKTLDSDPVLNFIGTLRKYNITGRVVLGGAGAANFQVQLTGTQNAATTTDSNGNYSFTGVNAGGDYQVTPAPTVLRSFPPQAIASLSGNQVLNFSDVPRRYLISGRVTDVNNVGVTGISLILGGSETLKTKSDSSGNYTLSATVLGNYTVTPAIEQDYFTLAPASQSVTGLIGDRVLNFSANLKPVPDPQRVLEFDGTPKTVDHALFWPAFTNLGPFYWEFWAMPGPDAGATYMLSDGYGGLHALLFGFSNMSASEPGRYEMAGNVNDGVMNSSHIFSFGSDHGPAIGEWGHLAVGWDGRNIITYFDGVPVGKTSYSLPRMSTGPGNGAGRLLIGGSDHANFRGRIAQVRGYEGSNPRMSTSVEASFAPQTVFGLEGNLLSYYFSPAPSVADLSRGYQNASHYGIPRGTVNGVLADCGSCPPPQFVIDPTAPNFATNQPPQPVVIPAALPAPAGALLFDSFSRANSTYLFGSQGGLGSTESGSAGPQVWQMKEDENNLRPFGILNGKVVLLADDTAVCWVNTGSTSGNLDVRVIRTRGRWGSGRDTGLSFRVVDQANYFFAYTSDSVASPGLQFLNVGSVLNGVRATLVSGVVIPANWSTLRVVTRANGTIIVLIDATQVYATSNTALADATKAGLFNNAAGLGLLNRWDNFMVFDAGS